MSQPKLLLNNQQIQLIVKRLTLQLLENHGDFAQTAIVGLQPRGIAFASKIVKSLSELAPEISCKYGELDHTFFRDDVGRGEIMIPKPSNIQFSTENLRIILIDDVLYTGRSIRSSIDALMSFGRPSQIELMVLINRKFQRELPIDPNYIGTNIDSRNTGGYVKVEWMQDDEKVWLLNKK
jgi:pyrimidine operon attenuation protein/uracil phosphoribosyltransferase